MSTLFNISKPYLENEDGRKTLISITEQMEHIFLFVLKILCFNRPRQRRQLSNLMYNFIELQDYCFSIEAELVQLHSISVQLN
jgi:hypothetical protein